MKQNVGRKVGALALTGVMMLGLCPAAPAAEQGAKVPASEEAAELYTPVKAGDTRVTGFYNGTASLNLELIARYHSGAMSEDGGSLEIVQYNSTNGFAYAVSGVKGKLIAVDLNGDMAGEKVTAPVGTEYDIKEAVAGYGFAYGDMTSVAISPDGTGLAVAIQAEDMSAGGLVALFACHADGSLALCSAVSVGVQPDMVTFADHNTILTADEGEPREGTEGIDPKGSVTVVTIGENNTLTAEIVYFDRFDTMRDELTAAGVLVQKGKQPSEDFEPEYIAVFGTRAYIALQEANAVAVLDIPARAFTAVYPLGFQNYGETRVDLLKNGEIGPDTYENVFGIRMPDGISAAEIGGKTYLLTPNEGDSRSDWSGMDNEAEGKNSPTGSVTLDKKVVWFNAALWDGLDEERDYIFGGRSFTIYEITEGSLVQVYDSGSDFEEITAEQLPEYFNASNNKTDMDNRSGKKGPEPETVVTGSVNGRVYAFVGLERIGGVMVYDMTDPENTFFVNYINSREFDAAIQGDVSPEGLCFISAEESKTGNALLLTACEVSGTLAVYELTVPAEQNAGQSDFGVFEAEEDYRKAALWAAENELDGIRFSSERAYTRAQVITFLWRIAGSPEIDGGTAFDDVSSDAPYGAAVRWAVSRGITRGTSETTFSPDAACTEQQLITFLWRIAGNE